MKDETAITAACIKAINASGLAYVWRQGSGVVPTRRGWCHLGPEGIPDIVGFLRGGRFIAIETKTAASAPKPKKRGNGLTIGTTKASRAEAQAEWRARIEAFGGAATQAVSPSEALLWVRSLAESTAAAPAPRA